MSGVDITIDESYNFPSLSISGGKGSLQWNLKDQVGNTKCAIAWFLILKGDIMSNYRDSLLL